MLFHMAKRKSADVMIVIVMIVKTTLKYRDEQPSNTQYLGTPNLVT